MMDLEFKSLKLSELQALAKEKGLRGWTALRKQQLIEFLERNINRTPSLRTKKMSELRALAKWSARMDGVKEITIDRIP